MNYKIALSAAFFAAVGLTGCDSRYDNDRALTRANDINSGTTTAAAPVDLNAGQTSGSGSEDLGDDNVYHSDDGVADRSDDDAAIEDDEVLSGSTSEPMDDTKVSYSQTDLPGGMARDRNLRYGLIGNGTGMGLEDTTSKFMTDNYTLSDPTVKNHALVNTGALSAPTADQDALKDIKSGTSFEPENYYIEEED